MIVTLDIWYLNIYTLQTTVVHIKSIHDLVMQVIHRGKMREGYRMVLFTLRVGLYNTRRITGDVWSSIYLYQVYGPLARLQPIIYTYSIIQEYNSWRSPVPMRLYRTSTTTAVLFSVLGRYLHLQQYIYIAQSRSTTYPCTCREYLYTFFSQFCPRITSKRKTPHNPPVIQVSHIIYTVYTIAWIY